VSTWPVLAAQVLTQEEGSSELASELIQPEVVGQVWSIWVRELIPLVEVEEEEEEDWMIWLVVGE
jgi:hypothetical protein